MLVEILKRIPLYLLLMLFVFVLSGFFVLCILKDVFLFRKAGEKNVAQDVLIIEKGESFNEIVSKLDSRGFVYNKKIFSLILRLMMLDRLLKAGEYKIDSSTRMLTVLGKIIDGETIAHSFTVLPGSSACQVLQKLLDEKLLNGPIPDDFVDGDLLADTYTFKRGESRASFLRRIADISTKSYNKAWNERNPHFSYPSLHDAIIVASILEKEVRKKEDLSLASGAIYERLKRNMRLQIDATVVYSITHGCTPLGRNLLHSDLGVNSPFNTYIINGLPPSPISNPSLSTLVAALKPLKTNKIFFFLDNNNSHFSSSYEEHKMHIKHNTAAKKRSGK